MMMRNGFFIRVLVFIGFSLGMSTGYAADATAIQKADNCPGGLQVVVGNGQVGFAVALSQVGTFNTQIILPDATMLQAEREAVEGLKAGDLVSVVADNNGFVAMPYVDNLLNRVVILDFSTVENKKAAAKEIVRITAPLGTVYCDAETGEALVRAGLKAHGDAGDLKAYRKPWPKDIDEWTHWTHSANGNAVAKDRKAGPPRHYQWFSEPRWMRTHEGASSTSAIVTSGGRIYTTDRWINRPGDHSYDIVVNDMPDLKVSGKRAVVSPVSKEFIYRLQGTLDGDNWYDIAEYVSKQDAESYVFQNFSAKKGTKDFRVLTEQHFGLPAFEHFGKPAVGELDAFLPKIDKVGNISVEDGALKLAYGPGDPSGSSRTRYFLVPHSRGKIYASMQVQFEGLEPECVGQINWLRQNGWNGKTVTPVSLEIRCDGITLDHTDTVRRNPKTRLSGYDGKTVNVLFEFDLGTTGSDTLKVYLNPGNELPEPAAVFDGEFTFDRLQFALAGRGGSTLAVDNVRIGTRLKDVIQ